MVYEMNIATRHHFDVGANKHSPNDTRRGSRWYGKCDGF